jgi:hypothetical protein
VAVAVGVIIVLSASPTAIDTDPVPEACAKLLDVLVADSDLVDPLSLSAKTNCVTGLALCKVKIAVIVKATGEGIVTPPVNSLAFPILDSNVR